MRALLAALRAAAGWRCRRWRSIPSEMLADPALEARARAISAGLRCLVCQNQSIDDSDADLAARTARARARAADGRRHATRGRRSTSSTATANSCCCSPVVRLAHAAALDRGARWCCSPAGVVAVIAGAPAHGGSPPQRRHQRRGTAARSTSSTGGLSRSTGLFPPHYQIVNVGATSRKGAAFSITAATLLRGLTEGE